MTSLESLLSGLVLACCFGVVHVFLIIIREKGYCLACKMPVLLLLLVVLPVICTLLEEGDPESSQNLRGRSTNR